MNPKITSVITRRRLLKASFTGLIGTPFLNASKAFEYPSQPEFPKIKSYRDLGKTGVKVSDISIGGTSLTTVNTQAPNILKILLNAGVNFIDASPIYPGSEITIGNGIKGFDRKKLFICTKFFPRDTFTTEDVLNSFRKSLAALKTEYVDCYEMQNCLSTDLVKNENWHAALKQLKEEGRIRYAGIACHGTALLDKPRESMQDVLMSALNDGRYDLFLLVYNFLNYEEGKNVMQECSKKGIATVIMKTNPVLYLERVKGYLKDEAFKDYHEYLNALIERFKDIPADAQSFMQANQISVFNTLRDAAIKFVLDNDHVNTIPLAFENYEDTMRYLSLSGQRLNSHDTAFLSFYSNNLGRLYCRHGCHICEESCPNKVLVNTLLRFRHYMVGNDRNALALMEYNRYQGAKADRCLGCEGHCEKACPFSVPARLLLQDTHRLLNFM